MAAAAQASARMSAGAFAALALAACEPAPALYEERWRPSYHFTPARNWMNDPNGLVVHAGEVHLFFQHNPRGRSWGNLSWGHAVSDDFVRWRELPVAIPDRDVWIFSGSAVVDAENAAGFAEPGAEPALVAIYTGYDPATYAETQHLSYSLDRGRTWRDHPDNPILARADGAFRDPKVVRHAPSGRWILTAVRSDEREVVFYASDNLVDWEEVGAFGPAGETRGRWETPELLEVPVDGGGARWALVVGVTEADVEVAPAGGSGVQYFLGDFDGRRFVAEGGPDAPPRWVDWGADFYAPQSWSGAPEADGRRIWIAWQANTAYALETPTRPWRGQMTIPRSLHVAEIDGRPTLVQRPIDELETLRGEGVTLRPVAVADAATTLDALAPLGDALELDLVLQADGAAEAGLRFAFGRNAELRVGYDARAGVIFVDRTDAGRFDAAGFAARHEAPVAAPEGDVALRIFLDRSSVEVFAADGATVISDLIFPDAPLAGVDVYAEGGEAALARLEAWRLEAIPR